MADRITVLFLPRWYPNHYDPMAGLFVQRQAEAVSEFCDVVVLYAHPVEGAANKYEVDISFENKIHTLRVYYRIPTRNIPLLSACLKTIRFIGAYRRGFRQLKNFKPDLIHVHILTRHGLIAWFCKLSGKIPYLVSEHWSRYFPENGSYKGRVRKWLTKKVVRNAAALITVSEKLKNAMIDLGLGLTKYYTVPNVVDFNFFKPDSTIKNRDKKEIVHVSCFEDKSKNISGFLNVLKTLTKKRSDFICRFIGEGPDLEIMKTYASVLGLNEDIVVFTGLKEGNELLKLMNSADFLVLSSHYETFGTVIAESFACGVPVIATEVGIVPEIVNQDNGICIPVNDDLAMIRAMETMLNGSVVYEKEKIRSAVIRKFSPEVIGKQIFEIYKEVWKR
ncbi:MAG: glycosyltransferase [Bacteroidetes bacterium]|nr:glycosyltransferase [Bacteroidota bacterium]